MAQRTLRPRGGKRDRLISLKTKLKIEHHSNAQLGWDGVKSVRQGIAQPTLAIEIEGIHTHVTEGLVSHNTMNAMKMRKLPTGFVPDDPQLLAEFKALCPVYWAQAQEYLRMSGYRTMRFTIMEPSYPFALLEVAVPYTPQDALPIREKYMRVRQAVVDQNLPIPCCAPGSAESRVCFARDVCPVGRMNQ
jgi:hypothetical protein